MLGRWEALNDYLNGAFEALSWVHAGLLNFDPEKEPLDNLDDMIKNVEAAMRDIQRGAAVNFRYKLRR